MPEPAQETRSRRLPPATVLVLGLLTALGPLSIDLYLPAFPALRREFDASEATVQFTLAGMTLGLALGQLLVGAWSDRAGRRRPLLLSTTVHIVSTVGCALAPTVEVLSGFRFTQGLGAAGSAVLVMAMVRDLAEGRMLVVLLSRVTLVTTTVPLIAPVAGAELLGWVGWRGIFGVLAAFSATVLLAAALRVPETHRPGPDDGPPLHVRLRTVARARMFRRATLVGSMTYAGVYAYVAASPLLLQDVYGLSPRAYALVFLANSLGLVAGVQLASAAARRFGPARVLAVCVAVTVVAAAALLPLQWADAGVAGLLACLWLFVTGCGGCFPTGAALAFEEHGAQAGTATSLYGFCTFATAGLVSPLAGLLGITSAAPVAAVLLGTSLVALAGAASLLGSDPVPAREPASSAEPAG